MTKDEIRKHMLAQRAALSEDVRKGYSYAIATHLWQLRDYTVASSLHVYLAIHNEVDTSPIIERAWNEGKQVLVPVVYHGIADLEHTLYLPDATIQPGDYGTLQPSVAQTLTTDRIKWDDVLVLVPLVAYDRQCYRIGYGRGFYDRFLATIRAKRYGLAYSFQFVEHFDHDTHDIPLDGIITELGVVR